MKRLTKTYQKRNGVRNAVIILIGIALLLSVFSGVLSTLIRADEATRITDALGISGYSAMLVGPDGTIHVVWHDDRTGNFEIFYNQVQEDNFINWPDDLQVTNRSGDSKYPSLAMDDYGNVHIVWQDDRNGNNEIYYKKIDSSGTMLTSDERVTNDPADSIRPTIEIDSDNNAHVVWYDNRNGNYEIFWDKRVEPDLHPTSILLTPEQPRVGEEVTIQIMVQNLGDNDAEDVTVECVVDGTSHDTQIITLGEQSSQLVTFSWIAEFGFHEVEIQVDPENHIAERNENDNTIGAPILGYDETYFESSPPGASARVRHAEEMDVTIEAVADPKPEGTQNSLDAFYEFTSAAPFENACIQLSYDQDIVGDLAESTLLMYSWDPYDSEGAQWKLIEDSGVNTEEDYVWANVSHFSIFTAIGMIKGDLDGDGDVDLSDLAQLLAHYGTQSGAAYEDGDIDGDGDVDLSDLAALLANYGAGG